MGAQPVITETMTIAYLNRPTKDGRTIDSMHAAASFPLPVRWGEKVVGRVVSISIDPGETKEIVRPEAVYGLRGEDTVWATVELDIDIDWSLWCLTAVLEPEEVMHADKALVFYWCRVRALTVSPLDQWPW